MGLKSKLNLLLFIPIIVLICSSTSAKSNTKQNSNPPKNGKSYEESVRSLARRFFYSSHNHNRGGENVMETLHTAHAYLLNHHPDQLYKLNWNFVDEIVRQTNNYQTDSKRCLDPQKVYDEYRQFYGVEGRMALKGSARERELARKHEILEAASKEVVESVTESLEAIIDHYKKGLKFEGMLESLHKLYNGVDYPTDKEVLAELRALEPDYESLRGFLNKYGQILASETTEEVSLDRDELAQVILDTVATIGEDVDNIIYTVGRYDRYVAKTRSKATREMADEKVNWLEMSMLLRRYIPALVKAHILPDFDLDTGKLKFKDGSNILLPTVPLNITIFEQLLTLYQRLDGLKNVALQEKSPKLRKKLEDEVETLEFTAIPRFTTQNRKEFKSYPSSMKALEARNFEKLDQLYVMEDQAAKAAKEIYALGERVLDDYEDVLSVGQELGLDLGDTETMAESHNDIISDEEEGMIFKDEL